MAKITSFEIARDFDLFGEYVDPDANMTEEQWDALTVQERVELIEEIFPESETQTTITAQALLEMRLGEYMHSDLDTTTYIERTSEGFVVVDNGEEAFTTDPSRAVTLLYENGLKNA